ncbi:MAG TPA: hypothetical protein VN782_06030 [Usitatibacter sp.]|nr:hypothetical protein [Usitatibacter sp.]
MTEQRIHILPRDEGEAASRAMVRRYETLAGSRATVLDTRQADELGRNLAMLEALDHQYGGSAPIELEGTEALVASILVPLARLGDAELVIAAALWALRHRVEITAVEPVANALAERSNRSDERRELVAVFSLMQAVIDNVRDRLGADLERSNPERPWRVLHANLAITAIRTEDPALLDAAFDALDAALPDERAAFYSEALALALAPGIAPAVRERIEERHRRWTARPAQGMS